MKSVSLETRFQEQGGNNLVRRRTNFTHPVMCFVSLYPRQDMSRLIILGCSQPSWGSFTELSTITREARNNRLTDIIGFCRAAFRRLAVLDSEMSMRIAAKATTPRQQRVLKREARQGVITSMRNEPAFLGGLHEMGVALRGHDWAFTLPCYQCAATMGYQSPKEWPLAERQMYHATYDMAKRVIDDNPQMCAETEARLVSFGLNIHEGRVLKW
jgi:hypothetical protein